MGIETAIDLGRESIFTAIKLGFLPLLVGLCVGLFVSILQTATQIQEQTLSILPKLFAVTTVIYFIMPWLLQVLTEYATNIFTTMALLK
jgi:flagellar biosynthetic protein FliQ